MWSDSAKECVDKLTYAYTGPWRITATLDGGSYALVHCNNDKCIQKKHASDLSPYHLHLLPLQHLDGSDSQYSQLYKDLLDNPFSDAGIEGFKPPKPFTHNISYARVGTVSDFQWPTFADFNDELSMPTTALPLLPIMALTRWSLHMSAHHRLRPTCTIPPIPSLVASIIASDDKLFFIAHKFGTAGDYHEWRLVRVTFNNSIGAYPSCLQTDRFLVDFYIMHPADIRYNATNQRYWLQYHTHHDVSDHVTPLDTTSCPAGGSSTSLMRTLTFAAHLTLPRLKGGKCEITLATPIGIFYPITCTCFATPSHLWTSQFTPSTWIIHSTLRRLHRSPVLTFLMETHLDDALIAVLRLFGLTNTPQTHFFSTPCLLQNVGAATLS